MGDQASSPGQIISLPKGGGALHGMGEKFSPDLHTGTGNFTVPIAIPPGRNGFQPQLNLVYSTGNGNGLFGSSWSLSIPGVARKTSKGIPQGRDYDPDLSKRDVFILSGAEDLVPIDDASLDPVRATRYRPRTEGLFAKIIHHHDASTNANFWEVSTKDGLLSCYGRDPLDSQNYATEFRRVTTEATIVKPKVDPREPDRIFAWKLTLTKDPFGNRIEYLYERRDQSGPLDEGDGHQWDQPLLTQIRYVDFEQNNQTKFVVAVTFNYEDRDDPFSNYRSGFEIRTAKRCKSILVETHTDQTRPVREYLFTYDYDRCNGMSLLQQIDAIGFDDAGNRYDGTVQHGSLRERQLPPLTFKYTQFDPAKKKFEAITGTDLPAVSLGNPAMELVDLYGAGLPDILEMDTTTVRYWRNRGQGRFDIPQPMRDAPAGMQLAATGVQLLDADGDGRTDLMVSGEPLAGYFPLEFPAKWSRQSFKKYTSAPSFDFEDPEVRLIDLTGDGVTDVLRSGTRMECFFNDSRAGWTAQNERWVQRKALEEFPNVNFSDSRVKIADMTGDGMQDIVLVHNSSVEYWPNMGYGNWGRRIHMKNSPRFPFGYDPKRILVGDVDGDGLADIVYVDHRRVTLWINRGGNGWSEPTVIEGTPPVIDTDGLRLTDLKGSGVAGILWSTDAGRIGPRNFMFLDFTGEAKPYLLNQMNNHLGAVTTVEYKPSTYFYLEDEKKRTTRWRTPLPFPVQVVAKVVVIDEISRGRLTTEYRYHHGYWDGAEREFRGFGMAEQCDSELIANYQQIASDRKFEAVPDVHFSPPTLTKTWFHLGPVGPEFGDWQEDLDWSNEFWSVDPPLLDHSEFVTPFLRELARNNPRGRRVRRDAVRALRGTIIRTEFYALDGSPNEDRPYTVTEFQYDLREVDTPTSGNKGHQRIFFPMSRGQRTTQWERGDDPLTIFSFTDNYDDFGQPRRTTSIACPRGWRSMSDRPTAEYLATRAINRYATPATNGPYIHDRTAYTTTLELTNTMTKTVQELRSLPDASNSLQVIGQVVNYFDGAEFVGLSGINFGKIGDYGAVTRTEQLVFTDAHLADAIRNTGISIPPWLDRQAPNWTAEYPSSFQAHVPALGGYVYRDGSNGVHAPGYFANTMRKAYDFQRGDGTRGMMRAERDPLDHETAIASDNFELLPLRVTNPVKLIVSAQPNYRVMQPAQITDPNLNTATAEYNPIGLLAKTWIRGKQANEGDSQRASVQLTYDFLAFDRNDEPINVRTLRYERHDTDSHDTQETIETREYSDGFGRLLQTRTQAEDVIYGNTNFGTEILPADITSPPGPLLGKSAAAGESPNVVVSPWQTYDNKGRVVHKYEPFFAKGWTYALPTDNQLGQKATMFYEPRGELIRTVNPDTSEQHVVRGIPAAVDDPPLTPSDTGRFSATPWEAYVYDANDNAGRTHATLASGYQHHWNTPASIVVDALGRTIRAIQLNRNAAGDVIQEYVTTTSYDLRGNIISVVDMLGRQAFQHVCDLGNRRLRLDSIDAGQRLTFFDAAGNLVETRDGRGSLTLRCYDDTNRPTYVWARDNSNEPITLRERRQYGDELADEDDAAGRNLRGNVLLLRDEAGLIVFERYDFKGNLLEKIRTVLDSDALADSEFRVDWENAPALDPAEYRISVSYDGLNRVTSVLYPEDVDGERKAFTPIYNHAGSLESVALDGDQFIRYMAYNAKGQRTLIVYGNGLHTRYDYDKTTFRLARMWTSAFTRRGDGYYPSGPPLQNLCYSYDLAANVTGITELVAGCGVRNNPDAALYPNLQTELGAGDALVREFGYDAIYRLISATGREAKNITSMPLWPDDFRLDGLNFGTPAVPNPGNARDLTRRYRESYEYDPAGNLLKLRHEAGARAWASHFGMSGFDPRQWRQMVENFFGGTAAHLSGTTNLLTNFGRKQNTTTHRFDRNGNLITEFTSRAFEWDHADRLRGFAEVDGAGNTSKSVRYIYDSAGQRVLKRAVVGDEVRVAVYIDGAFEHHIVGLSQNNTLHVTASRQRIAMVRIGPALQDDVSPNVQYCLGDHLGNANLVIGGADASEGIFQNREEYFPHGETSFGSFGRKRYRFSGKERDEETGLSYFGGRYLNASVCRWISCDRNTKDGLNLFVYVANNPITFVDPNGLDSTGFVVPGAGAGVGTGGAAGAGTSGAAGGGTAGGVGASGLWALAGPAIVIVAGVAAIATVTWIFHEGNKTLDAQDEALRMSVAAYIKFDTELKSAVAEGRVTPNQKKLLLYGDAPDSDTLEFVGAIDRLSAKLAPEHHIATDKNRKAGDRWTTIYEQLFDACGVSLQDAANKVRLKGHRGPHPPEYHMAVLIRILLDTLTRADARLVDKIGLDAVLQMKLQQILKDPKLRDRCAENLRKALEDIKQMLMENPDLVHSDYYEEVVNNASNKKPKSTTKPNATN